ncbi:MAG: hypothetical protein CM1200mP16_07010 [Nitrospina sp.]|nr:MAG: hypothetical protein CM1200mP16_07010 [Nitrospina sp.]
MTAYIVQVSLGDTPQGGVAYQTIFAVSALLFVITFCMNIFSGRLLKRFREVYECFPRNLTNRYVIAKIFHGFCFTVAWRGVFKFLGFFCCFM